MITGEGVCARRNGGRGRHTSSALRGLGLPALARLWATVRKRLDLRAFPEVGYGPWRFELERAALAVHAEHPVDLVVATTNPEVSVTAGIRLHETSGVPYVVDYRDAWSLHTYSGRRRHAAAYPALADRMHVVMNGYDRDVPTDLVRTADADVPLRFGYLGTMTHVVPLAEFVAGWRRGRERSDACDEGEVGHVLDHDRPPPPAPIARS